MNYETILKVIWIFKLFSDLLFNEKFLVRAKIVGHCIIGRCDGCCGEHVSSLLKFTIFCYFKDFITRSQSEWIVRKAVWYNFGYSYSAANKNMAVNWEEKTLYDYLLNPKK
ncbi:uncharacterized protein LOC142615101 [Castanea sativa]|uniref:uncharacterized protein LOC142615101 n=1 Tax=Castanea sativa TaxID=21020 RepID=UPI003F652E5C